MKKDSWDGLDMSTEWKDKMTRKVYEARTLEKKTEEAEQEKCGKMKWNRRLHKEIYKGHKSNN